MDHQFDHITEPNGAGPAPDDLTDAIARARAGTGNSPPGGHAGTEPEQGEAPPQHTDPRVPRRDIERDPRDPGMRGQIDAYLNPPDAQRAAIELGETGYVYTDEQAFGADGRSGRVGEVINNETDVRKGAAHLDHAREIAEQETIVGTADLRAIETVGNTRRTEAIAAHEAKVSIEHLEQHAPERKAALEDELEGVETEIGETKVKIENASLIERISAKVCGWHIALLGAIEGLTQTLTLAPAYSAQAMLTFAYQDLLTALMVGVIITLAASITGVLLASLAPQRGAKAILIAAVVVVAWRLYRHIDAVREGTDQAMLFLTDVSVLGAVATCAIAFLLAINKAFKPVFDRLAELMTKREQLKAAITALPDQLLAARLAAHGVTAGPELIASVLAQGVAAQVQADTLKGIADKRLGQEDAFGLARLGLARVAHGKARDEELPGPEEIALGVPPLPVGADAGQPGRGWLLAALASLGAGVAGWPLTGQVLVFAGGCALAGVVLIAALLRGRARAGATPAGTADAGAPDGEQTVSLHENPLWKRLPTSTYARTRDGGADPTQDI